MRLFLEIGEGNDEGEVTIAGAVGQQGSKSESRDETESRGQGKSTSYLILVHASKHKCIQAKQQGHTCRVALVSRFSTRYTLP